jgi:hypothetical protein
VPILSLGELSQARLGSVFLLGEPQNRRETAEQLEILAQSSDFAVCRLFKDEFSSPCSAATRASVGFSLDFPRDAFLFVEELLSSLSSSLVNLPEEVAIYGAGFAGAILHQALERSGRKVVCVLDRDTSLSGSTFYGSPILPPSEISSCKNAALLLAIDPKHIPGAIAQLSKYGLDSESVIAVFDESSSSIDNFSFPKVNLMREVEVDGEAWFEETGYQSFLYREHGFRPLGPTADKISLLEPLVNDAIRGKTFLDIGCEAGACVHFAALSGAKRALGIDVSPNTVLRATLIRNSIGSKNSAFKYVGLPEPSFAGHFDTVCAFSVMHHLYFVNRDFNTFEESIAFLASLAEENLIIEYVGDAPECLIANFDVHRTDSEEYNEDNFLSVLHQLFDKVNLLGETSPSRRLYWANTKKCSS